MSHNQFIRLALHMYPVGQKLQDRIRDECSRLSSNLMGHMLDEPLLIVLSALRVSASRVLLSQFTSLTALQRAGSIQACWRVFPQNYTCHYLWKAAVSFLWMMQSIYLFIYLWLQHKSVYNIYEGGSWWSAACILLHPQVSTSSAHVRSRMA